MTRPDLLKKVISSSSVARSEMAATNTADPSFSVRGSFGVSGVVAATAEGAEEDAWSVDEEVSEVFRFLADSDLSCTVTGRPKSLKLFLEVALAAEEGESNCTKATP